MYYTKVVRDEVTFQFYADGHPPKATGFVKHVLWSENQVSFPSLKRTWQLPGLRSMRRLTKKFLGTECEIVNDLGIHGYTVVLPVGTPREDRAAFLAAVAVNTKIKRD